MKSPLLVVLVALQLATLGVVVGLLLQRNGSSSAGELDQLGMRLDGALNQERIIIAYLDELRRQSVATPKKGDPSASAAPPGTAVSATGTEPSAPKVEGTPPPPPAVADSPFPEAAAALAELKLAEKNRRSEAAKDAHNVGPLDVEVDKRRSALLARGHQAVFVVRREVNLQPFEKERDAKFVEYLLNDVVPALSSAAKEDAFEIARSALVRATNEGSLKTAAARALRAVDSQRWVKDVCDVIASGERNVTVREQLLGLFGETPKPEAVELSQRILEDAREDPALRVRAIEVLAKQDSSAVNPSLNRILFDDPAPVLKNHALDALCERLTDVAERKTLLQKVVDANPAQMPDTLREKATLLLEKLK